MCFDKSLLAPITLYLICRELEPTTLCSGTKGCRNPLEQPSRKRRIKSTGDMPNSLGVVQVITAQKSVLERLL